MKRFVFLIIFVLARTSPVFAQMPPTVVLSDTSKLAWTPSPDNNVVFGTPSQPVLTSYRGELFLKANVTATVVGAVTTFTPTGNPALTFDFGKPVIDGGNTQSGPPLKPLLISNTEYIAFLRAIGPGGTSPRSNGTGPFGSPSAPRTAETLGLTP